MQNQRVQETLSIRDATVKLYAEAEPDSQLKPLAHIGITLPLGRWQRRTTVNGHNCYGKNSESDTLTVDLLLGQSIHHLSLIQLLEFDDDLKCKIIWEHEHNPGAGYILLCNRGKAGYNLRSPGNTIGRLQISYRADEWEWQSL